MSNLTFAKIVVTPTITSWSQAYNAGGLFAVLSLESKNEEPLGVLGKDVLNALEEEYFTLEEKTLVSIRQAVINTYKKIPDNISPSFVVVSIIDNVLYAFVVGVGKVAIKRNEKVGQILVGTNNQEEPISSSSGYLEDGDLIIIQTNQFSKMVSHDELVESLDTSSPLEIAERLSPKIHETQEGGAAAIIIAYKTPEQKEVREEKESLTEEEKKSYLPSFPSFPSFSNVSSLPHSKKLLLSVVAILALILMASVYFAKQKQEEAKVKAAFDAVYSSAQKKYDDGQNLLNLNKNLARDNLNEAQRILNESRTKFTKGSKEEQQIQDLLKKTEEALISASEVNLVEAKEVGGDKSKILSATLRNKDAKYFVSDGAIIYFANEKGVFVDGKDTAKIKNDNYWQEVGGLGVYLGNIYVLDKKNGIQKFVGGEAANKASYFASGVSPDLTKAISMTIDASIWLLMQDGSVLKFTRGKADNFTISGLDKAFARPLRISTSVDFDKVYVLDNGNSRIVILNKDGLYQSQYQAKILKDAKDFEVLETSKKIYILSQGKIWEINLK